MLKTPFLTPFGVLTVAYDFLRLRPVNHMLY